MIRGWGATRHSRRSAKFSTVVVVDRGRPSRSKRCGESAKTPELSLRGFAYDRWSNQPCDRRDMKMS